MIKIIHCIGEYFLFLRLMFVNRIRNRVLISRSFEEAVEIGVNSILLIIMTSFFIGIICTIQSNETFNLNPLLPKKALATSIRNMIILELAGTISGIIFSARNGSNMAIEISSMKISEQVDAIKTMGINVFSYLALPKIIASTFVFPLLVIISAFISMLSAYAVGVYFLSIPSDVFLTGYTCINVDTHLDYLIIKSTVFGFFSNYKTANVIGQASNYAFICSCLSILIADFVLTSLFIK